MPTKRYRLKLEHPYAEKGTIVKVSETFSDTDIMAHSDTDMFSIPKSKFDTWLEEVKEEVTFTKEQADALKMKLQAVYGDLYHGSQHTGLVEYIDARTSTDE